MILVVTALTIQTIQSVCIDQTTTTTTTTTAPPVYMYHPCPRSMNNWLLKNHSIVLRCAGGPSNNLCSNNLACNSDGSTANVCCQQSDGCNACVGNKTK
jgi:hypothetical protein